MDIDPLPLLLCCQEITSAGSCLSDQHTQDAEVNIYSRPISTFMVLPSNVVHLKCAGVLRGAFSTSNIMWCGCVARAICEVLATIEKCRCVETFCLHYATIMRSIPEYLD